MEVLEQEHAVQLIERYHFSRSIQEVEKDLETLELSNLMIMCHKLNCGIGELAERIKKRFGLLDESECCITCGQLPDSNPMPCACPDCGQAMDI